jgi:hypothetical protein
VILIAAICAAIGALSWLSEIPVWKAATAIGSVSTAMGIVLALLSLRNAQQTLQDAHEWNRRHYTVEFLSDWNERARTHLAELERKFPDFFAVPDFINNPEEMKSWRMHHIEAKNVVAGGAGDKLEIRTHLIDLLNYFEGIASAYEQYVVDRLAVEDSVGTVIQDVYVYFQPFIEEMRQINRRDPWPPLSRVVDVWLAEAKRQKAEEKAEEASLGYREALEKGVQKRKGPTGV